MKTLIVGKNSFLSKNLSLNNTTKISHKDLDNVDIDKFDRLFLISFPPIYKKRKEKIFLFEKKLLDRFFDKKILYFSTQKVYPYKLNCNETDETLPDSIYAENKMCIEKLILERTNKFQIFRVSSVFSSTKYAEESFFSQLRKKWNFESQINFDISLESIKDFITIDRLNLILNKIINSDNHGIFNIGSKTGLSIIEILNIIFKNSLPNNIKQSKNSVKSRTLDNNKICTLFNFDGNKIHNETKKQITNMEL